MKYIYSGIKWLVKNELLLVVSGLIFLIAIVSIGVIFSKEAIQADLVPTIVTSLVAVFFAYIFTRIYSAMQRYYIFGKYDEYSYEGYSDGKANGSTATLKYDADNRLTLTLTEKDGKKWCGSVAMSDEQNGTVVWRYVEGNNIDRGFKYLTVYDKGDIILLQNILPLKFIREPNSEIIIPFYGQEELKRKKE